MEKPPAPKPKSKLDKAKELEDFMYSKKLSVYEVQELLAIIQYYRSESAR